VWVAAALAAFVVGCESCRNPTRTFLITESEVAIVTHGTASPTLDGCEYVCGTHDLNGDVPIDYVYVDADIGVLDGGPAPDAGSPNAATLPLETFGRAESCTLDGRVLTCVWPVVCAL